MKTIWYIAKKDLLQAFKDRNSIIFMLLMPMILITVIGLALGNIFGGSGPIQVTIGLYNQDTGPNNIVGNAIVEAFKTKTSQVQFNVQNYSDTSQLINVLTTPNSSLNVGIIIPSNTTQEMLSDIQNHQSTNNLIQLYTLPGTPDARAEIAQGVARSVINTIVSSEYASSAAIGQVETVCNTSGNHCAQNTIDTTTISQAVNQAILQATQTAPVQQLTAGYNDSNVFDQYVPGYAIFFSLFSINAVAGTILQEKEDGTFRRLLIAPIQKFALLGGKVLAQFVLTTIQLAALFLFGYLFFHIHINDFPAILLLILGTSFGATGIGIVLVSIVKTRRQLAPLVTLVTLISAAIGGLWWPLWLEPTWLQNFAKIGLPAWAMEGLTNVMTYNRGLSAVIPDIIGLFGYGLICYLIGLRLFRFQEKAA